jgi:hypothetical protein
MSHFVRAFILLLAFVFLLSAKSLANPGDITWVQAQYDVQPDWYNDFDTPVNFPSCTVSYRKIIMVLTLGNYQCPAVRQMKLYSFILNPIVKHKKRTFYEEPRL